MNKIPKLGAWDKIRSSIQGQIVTPGYLAYDTAALLEAPDRSREGVRFYPIASGTG